MDPWAARRIGLVTAIGNSACSQQFTLSSLQ